MSMQAILLLYVCMAAVTYISRRLLLRMPNRVFSGRLINGLTFIPIGIFAGLIFPSLFVKDGGIVVDPFTIIAAVLCLGLMRISKNVFLSFGVSLLFIVVVTVLQRS